MRILRNGLSVSVSDRGVVSPNRNGNRQGEINNLNTISDGIAKHLVSSKIGRRRICDGPVPGPITIVVDYVVAAVIEVD